MRQALHFRGAAFAGYLVALLGLVFVLLFGHLKGPLV